MLSEVTDQIAGTLGGMMGRGHRNMTWDEAYEACNQDCAGFGSTAWSSWGIVGSMRKHMHLIIIVLIPFLGRGDVTSPSGDAIELLPQNHAFTESEFEAMYDKLRINYGERFAGKYVEKYRMAFNSNMLSWMDVLEHSIPTTDSLSSNYPALIRTFPEHIKETARNRMERLRIPLSPRRMIVEELVDAVEKISSNQLIYSSVVTHHVSDSIGPAKVVWFLSPFIDIGRAGDEISLIATSVAPLSDYSYMVKLDYLNEARGLELIIEFAQEEQLKIDNMKLQYYGERKYFLNDPEVDVFHRLVLEGEL